MSRTRRKTHSEREHLLGRIRELEKENRRLRKENKFLSKRTHMYENVIDDAADEIKTKKATCKQCRKGELQTFDFVHVIVTSCDACEYQRRTKPKGRKT